MADIVRRYFDDASALDLTTRLREDLGADSLDLLELMYALEREFGIQIPDAEAATLRTLGDTVRYVERSGP